MSTTAGSAPATRPARLLAEPWRTDALLFLMALIWAVNFSVLKYGTRLVAPLAYNGVRIPLAAALQLGIARSVRKPAIASRDRRALILLGLLGNGVYQVLFILGVSRTRVATTVLILASGPALVAILGRLRGSERISRHGWVGIILQLLGVSCVVMGTAGSGAGSDSLLGGLMVLVAAISWAFYSVFVKPYSERVSGLHIGGYTMLGGSLLAVAVAAPGMLSTPWTALPASLYGALFYSSAGALVLAYLFWYRGVRVIGPTHTSMYSNLQPILAMAVAWMFLREVPSRWQLAGMGCIMSGLLIARIATAQPEAP